MVYIATKTNKSVLDHLQRVHQIKVSLLSHVSITCLKDLTFLMYIHKFHDNNVTWIIMWMHLMQNLMFLFFII